MTEELRPRYSHTMEQTAVPLSRKMYVEVTKISSVDVVRTHPADGIYVTETGTLVVVSGNVPYVFTQVQVLEDKIAA